MTHGSEMVAEALEDGRLQTSSSQLRLELAPLPPLPFGMLRAREKKTLWARGAPAGVTVSVKILNCE